MTIRDAKCESCGQMFHIDELDAKPEVQGDENQDFTRLECKTCYGRGFIYGREFHYLNNEQEA